MVRNRNQTKEDSAVNKTGCTDRQGKKRKAGENWADDEDDVCNYKRLVSNKI